MCSTGHLSEGKSSQHASGSEDEEWDDNFDIEDFIESNLTEEELYVLELEKSGMDGHIPVRLCPQVAFCPCSPRTGSMWRLDLSACKCRPDVVPCIYQPYLCEVLRSFLS
jgi:hypothetical protein